MLLRIGDATGISIGSLFYRYYPELDNAFDRGQVTEVESITVLVDFGDTIMRYDIGQVAYVVNSCSQSEHFMACCSGELVSDFRSNPEIIPSSIEGFEDLLDQLG